MAEITKFFKSTFPRGQVIPSDVTVSIDYMDKATGELIRRVIGEPAAVEAFKTLISGTEVAQPAPIIDPVTFQLLFPAAARVALRGSTDPVVVDFLRLLDDPRLLTVDRNKASVIEAIDYVAAAAALTPDQIAWVKTGL